MKALSNGIVKAKWFLIALFIIIAGVACYGVTQVKTNYDIIKYLPKETETVLALDKMEAEFGSIGTAQVMIKDLPVAQIDALKLKLEALKGIKAVVAGNDEATYKDGNALFKLFLVNSSFSPEAKATIQQVRALLSDYDISMNGGAVSSEFLQSAIQTDMIIILLVACIIIAAILLITSTSWVDPLVFGLVVGVSLIINLGSNALLPEVSFITKAICAIMQLALAMDYSIILLHRFNEEKKRSLDNKEAMAAAIRGSFSSVIASSLTTVAGLIALVFMRFSIGIDVGVVLTKGIIISVFTVFLFMPGMLLLFAPLLEKTKHKSLHEKLTELNVKSQEKRQIKLDEEAAKNPNIKRKKPMGFIDFAYKFRKIIPAVVIIFVVAGAVMNSFVKYTYGLETSRNPEDSVNVEDKEIEAIFGKQNSLVVLVKQGNIKKEKELVDFMLNYKYKGEYVINGEQGMAAMGFSLAIPVDTLKGILSESDMKQLLKAADIPDSATEILLFDIIRALTVEDNKPFIDSIINRALGVVTNVLDMLESAYDATAFATTLNRAIAPLVPGVQLSAETATKLFELCGFDAAEHYTGLELISAAAEQKVAEQLLTAVNPSIAQTVQGLVETLAGIAPDYDTKFTAAELAAMIPLGDMTESIETLMLMHGAKTASVYQLIDWIGSNGLARSKIITAITDKLGFAFTMFESEGGLSRLMFNLNMDIATDDSFAAMKEISAGIRKLYEGEEVFIACETGAYSDIKDYFQTDSMMINLISFFAIFIIIMLSFRSFGVPALLTLLIQGAIWFGMAIQFMAASPVFFVCYLVVMCIQMGATVDYAILMTNRYTTYRQTMGRRDAMKKAFSSSIMTIMTSGSILVIAAFVVGIISKVAIIADIGMMLAIGCFISLFTIVTALPSILMLCDKLIQATGFTKSMRHFYKEPKPDALDAKTNADAAVLDEECTSLSGLSEVTGDESLDTVTEPLAPLCGLDEAMGVPNEEYEVLPQDDNAEPLAPLCGLDEATDDKE